MKGFIDGLDLTRFRVGNVYDVSAALATYLMHLVTPCRSPMRILLA